jgi:2-iminoacetate synthase
MTFKEYLLDFASPETGGAGEELITRLVGGMNDSEGRQSLVKRLARMEKGQRDLYV